MEKEKGYKIIMPFIAQAFFEIMVEIDGKQFLVIYGKHLRTHFCAIPQFKASCEMAEHNDIYYNTQKLMGIGIDMSEKMAKDIAMAIDEYASGRWCVCDL